MKISAALAAATIIVAGLSGCATNALALPSTFIGTGFEESAQTIRPGTYETTTADRDCSWRVTGHDGDRDGDARWDTTRLEIRTTDTIINADIECGRWVRI